MLSRFNEIEGIGGALRAMLDYLALGGPLIMWPLLAIAP